MNDKNLEYPAGMQFLGFFVLTVKYDNIFGIDKE